MSRWGYISWGELMDLIDDQQFPDDCLYTPPSPADLKILERDWQAWQEKKARGERVCMVCGNDFKITSLGAVITRLDEKVLHVCPRCAENAVAELTNIPREQLYSELKNNLEELEEPAT